MTTDTTQQQQLLQQQLQQQQRQSMYLMSQIPGMQIQTQAMAGASGKRPPLVPIDTYTCVPPTRKYKSPYTLSGKQSFTNFVAQIANGPSSSVAASALAPFPPIRYMTQQIPPPLSSSSSSPCPTATPGVPTAGMVGIASGITTNVPPGITVPQPPPPLMTSSTSQQQAQQQRHHHHSRRQQQAQQQQQQQQQILQQQQQQQQASSMVSYAGYSTASATAAAVVAATGGGSRALKTTSHAGVGPAPLSDIGLDGSGGDFGDMGYGDDGVACGYRPPMQASWFKMNAIHDIEKRALPDFFMGKSPFKTPEVYKEYRDYMITAAQQNAQKTISFAQCRRYLMGDVITLLRVYQFLEHWRLINASAVGQQFFPRPPSFSSVPPPPPPSQATTVDRQSAHPPRAAAAAAPPMSSSSTAQVQPPTSPSKTTAVPTAAQQQQQPQAQVVPPIMSMPITVAAAAAAMAQSSARTTSKPQSAHDYAATATTTTTAAAATISTARPDVSSTPSSAPVAKAPAPVTSGPAAPVVAAPSAAAPPQSAALSDVKTEKEGDAEARYITEAPQRPRLVGDWINPGELTPVGEGSWSEAEKGRLLDALLAFQGKWDDVERAVGTKTKEQCLRYFLQMPIEDPYLEDQITTVATMRREAILRKKLLGGSKVLGLATLLAATVDEAAERSKQTSGIYAAVDSALGHTAERGCNEDGWSSDDKGTKAFVDGVTEHSRKIDERLAAVQEKERRLAEEWTKVEVARKSLVTERLVLLQSMESEKSQEMIQ